MKDLENNIINFMIKILEDKKFSKSPHEVIYEHINLERENPTLDKEVLDKLNDATLNQLNKCDSSFIKKSLMIPMLEVCPILKGINLSIFSLNVIREVCNKLVNVPADKRDLLNALVEDRGYMDRCKFEVIINFEHYVKIEDVDVDETYKVVMYMLSGVTNMDLKINNKESNEYIPYLNDMYIELNPMIRGCWVGGEYWYCPPSKWKKVKELPYNNYRKDCFL